MQSVNLKLNNYQFRTNLLTNVTFQTVQINYKTDFIQSILTSTIKINVNNNKKLGQVA